MPQKQTIGHVARRAGVRTDTVRYYERRGLIPPPSRTTAGYRDFPAGTVRRIHFIRRAQQLGFTLDEIGQLLSLRDREETTCDDVMHLAQQKSEMIAAKINDLRAIQEALHRLLDSCSTRAVDLECPIIESLERSRTTH